MNARVRHLIVGFGGRLSDHLWWDGITQNDLQSQYSGR